MLHEGRGEEEEGQGKETYVHCPFVRNFRGIENSLSVCRLADDEANDEDEEDRLEMNDSSRTSFSSTLARFFSRFGNLSFRDRSKFIGGDEDDGRSVVVVVVHAFSRGGRDTRGSFFFCVKVT